MQLSISSIYIMLLNIKLYKIVLLIITLIVLWCFINKLYIQYRDIQDYQYKVEQYRYICETEYL